MHVTPEPALWRPNRVVLLLQHDQLPAGLRRHG
jgi:hypothetical protein